jgi:hypothetical protein
LKQKRNTANAVFSNSPHERGLGGGHRWTEQDALLRRWLRLTLEESDHNYSVSELPTCVMYALRDRIYLCEPAAPLSHQKYTFRHHISPQ